MRRVYYTLIFSLLFISCNIEENIIIDTKGEVYTFLLEQQEIEPSPWWSIGDAIGITAYVSGSEEIYSNYVNKRYNSNGNNSFTPATEGDEILHGHSVDFIAYHPYKADAYTSYAISLNEQSDQKQVDLLYSDNAKNKSKTSGIIELTFDHVLSKILINTTPSGGLKEEDLYGMSITINNVYTESTFDLVDETIETSGAKANIKMKTGASGSLSEAILIPGPISGVSFTIELANGRVYDANFPHGEQFAPGHIYIFNVTICQIGITLNPIEIEDWQWDGVIPEGEISDEIIYKIGDLYPNPNDPKTAIGIVYWLKDGVGGREGKIVSFDSAMRNWSDSNDENLTTNISIGMMNWDLVVQRDPTLENFPAFKWCLDKGEGWFLPSRYELHILNEIFIKYGEYMNSNIGLIDGGEPFTSSDVYLASTESRSWPDDSAETYYFSNKGWLPIKKNVAGRIRATKEF